MASEEAQQACLPGEPPPPQEEEDELLAALSALNIPGSSSDHSSGESNANGDSICWTGDAGATHPQRRQHQRQQEQQPHNAAPSDPHRKHTRSKAQREVVGQQAAADYLSRRESLPPGVSEADIICICGQLGYVPPNLVSVAARNGEGEPTVLLLYPLARPVCTRRNNVPLQPFPTIYWLCCPRLKADVSRLEVLGLVQEYEDRLRASPEHMATLQRQHRAYADRRWAMLSEEDRSLVQERGWSDCLDGRVGVAGLRLFDTVKCLHAHYCHFLGTGSGDNLVGSWVQEALDSGLHKRKPPS